MRKSTHLIVRLAPAFRFEIGAAARVEGVSKSEFTRRAVAERIARTNRRPRSGRAKVAA